MSCITGVSRFRRAGVNSRSAEYAGSEIGFIKSAFGRWADNR